MKNVFVDTNILIDLLADRLPFSKFAIQLFDQAEKKESQTVYILSRFCNNTLSIKKTHRREGIKGIALFITGLYRIDCY